MIELVRYTNENKGFWNDLVSRSRNGTFLLNRDYMDYHSDRFVDCSFLVYKKGKLCAVLPGNIDGTSFFSHQGLTYGGFVTLRDVSTSDMLAVFEKLNETLKNLGITRVVYKAIPTFYHLYPAQEDIYAIFRNEGRLTAVQPTSLLVMRHRIPFTESRKSGIRKAKKSEVSLDDSIDALPAFWAILEENLASRHGSRPVHTLEEIVLLHSRFPENIRLHTASTPDRRLLAGTVMYLSDRVAHVQYISANEEGKNTGALDLLFDRLINIVYADYPCFDFGTSTEQGGRVLNESLIFQKEGFGGRTSVYETFEYEIGSGFQQ